MFFMLFSSLFFLFVALRLCFIFNIISGRSASNYKVQTCSKDLCSYKRGKNFADKITKHASNGGRSKIKKVDKNYFISYNYFETGDTLLIIKSKGCLTPEIEENRLRFISLFLTKFIFVFFFLSLI